MIIAELIEQLTKMDLTLKVYVETDTDVAPVHSIDLDQFEEESPGVFDAVVLIATEETREAGPASPPEVQPGEQGDDFGTTG